MRLVIVGLVVAVTACTPAPDPHLEPLRRCESHGNYSAVSKSGTYRGAYQFHRRTWDATARRAGRSDLVGHDPATATPWDQDTLAVTLWDHGRGRGHWPVCGRRVR